MYQLQRKVQDENTSRETLTRGSSKVASRCIQRINHDTPSFVDEEKDILKKHYGTTTSGAEVCPIMKCGREHSYSEYSPAIKPTNSW